MKIKINYILAFLGAFFALDAFRIASVLSMFSGDIGIIGMVVLIIGIVGLSGIYFYNKSDYNVASLIYLIAGILIILLLTIDSSLFSCIFYIIAAIVAYVEGKREVNVPGNIQGQSPTGHYFNTDGEYPQYNNMNNNMNNTNRSFDTKLLIIPVAIILVILVAVLAFNMTGDNTPALNISNIKINSEGYSMYTVSCDLIPNREYNYLALAVVFYDSSNAEIGKSSLVWNVNNPTKGQLIKVSGTALTNNANMKPARATLYFFDKAISTDPKDAIFTQNITIN